jgi:hypothetical protein
MTNWWFDFLWLLTLFFVLHILGIVIGDKEYKSKAGRYRASLQFILSVIMDYMG